MIYLIHRLQCHWKQQRWKRLFPLAMNALAVLPTSLGLLAGG